MWPEIRRSFACSTTASSESDGQALYKGSIEIFELTLRPRDDGRVSSEASEVGQGMTWDRLVGAARSRGVPKVMVFMIFRLAYGPGHCARKRVRRPLAHVVGGYEKCSMW